MAEQGFDYIIVGGGSSGCVLASRLTENPVVRVLLLEAGGKDDNPLIHMPVGFAKMTSGPYTWGLTTVPQRHANNRALIYAQGRVLDESHWNTSSSVDHQPYPRSKVAAEQAAWAIAEGQSRWDLVVINPGLVLGPALTRHSASESLVIMGDLLKGKLRTGVPQLEIALVDVRDVAHAHVRAAFIEQAQGRHVLVNQTLTMLQMAQLIGQQFQGRFKLPKMELPKWLIWLAGPTQGISRKFVSLNVGHELRFDNSKSRQELGLEYRPIADTLAAHVQQMLDDGVVRG